MDIIEIGNLITGIATLIVAIVLLLQLRTNHSDSYRELTFKSFEIGQSRMSSLFKDKELSDIYLKSSNGSKTLNEHEKFMLFSFFALHFGQLATDYTLGRARREDYYYKTTMALVMNNKAGCEWYLDQGRKFFENTNTKSIKQGQVKFLQRIGDELYFETTGEEIKL